jgi:DNA-binding response OmpR family regulator
MPAKILIVDDEPNIVLSLEFLFRKQGFEVFIARDGAEALAILEKQTPDVAILDIMMPNVDGYEVCKQIKQDLALPTKVAFLTAKTKEADIQKGYEVGADLYITKPFSTRNLLKQVQELLIAS